MKKYTPIEEEDENEYEEEPCSSKDFNYEYDTFRDTFNTEHNSQIDMNDLLAQIQSEVQEIDNYTAFGKDWTFLYFNACGWKKNLCQDFVDVEQNHKKMIHFTSQFIDSQGSVGTGECMLCCEENKQILRNICGEEFCEDCWTGHIKERLRSYYTEPFPPCISDGCPIKTSPKLLFALA